jgi:chorismate lyase / 3-hydroxybenzoate synthase
VSSWLVDTQGVSELSMADTKLPLLAGIRFGYRAGESGQFRLDLPSLYPHMECWRPLGQLRCGQLGAAGFASDDEFMLAELILNEDEGGGLIRTTTDAYKRIAEYTHASPYAHILRVWTYFSAINYGAGDAERYKQFCVGRARAIGAAQGGAEPAATVIGRVGSASPWLHVMWLSGKAAGMAVDNPRQTRPKHYSRQFGPEPPRFSRGMLGFSARGTVLFISGTAAVVGEASLYPGDLARQFGECTQNLEAVLAQACAQLHTSSRFSSDTIFRVYVREEERLFEVASLMRQRFPSSPFCVIAGEVCRAELLLEIEAVHHF